MIIAALAALVAVIAIIRIEKRHDDEFDARMRTYEEQYRTITYRKEPK
jgi:hypothetical protein